MGSRKPAHTYHQGRLFAAPPDVPAAKAPVGRRTFSEPNRAQLRFGAVPLNVYLKEVGDLMPLLVAKLLDSLDWGDFESEYEWGGRAPYAPRLMVGLVLYGLLTRCSSLRELERLASRDLGCMWVTAGIRPDHSVIGRFIERHQTILTEGFFEQLTKKILRVTGGDAKRTAIDGTMVQAAASRYRTVQREALDKKLDENRQRAEHDPAAKERLKRYEDADAVLKEREQVRKAKGRDVRGAKVSTTEPEAIIQPLKNKSFAPSYKASALANEQRIMTATDVHPTSEVEVVGDMLDQSARVAGHKVEEVSGDAAYCSAEVIDATLERNVSLLTSETGAKEPAQFAKYNFKYDEQTDSYICPAGETLRPVSTKLTGYRTFRATNCQQCPFVKRCVTAKKTKNRSISRYPVDEFKEALREVMSQTRAQQRYKRRKTTVEPVFASTAHLGLRRFRRRGLLNVRMEFALYAAAHNVTRLFALLGLSGALRRILRIVRRKLSTLVAAAALWCPVTTLANGRRAVPT